MTFRAKLVAFLALFLWSSAFVAIRAGLDDFTPGGLALMRYLVASGCMVIIYNFIPNKVAISLRDRLFMLAMGALGIGLYNLCLNYGEMTVTSGTASFIIGQSPIFIALAAVASLGERVPRFALFGFVTSIFGVCLIAFAEQGGFSFNIGFVYVLLATLVGSIFTVYQKPYLVKYHAIQATAHVVWGGTLFLLLFLPALQHDLAVAHMRAISAAVYLGIFPAAVGYIAWGYVLKVIPASRAGSFLYATPFMATLLGWLFLNEVPVALGVLGGMLAMLGVILVNMSYKKPAPISSAKLDEVSKAAA